MSFELDNYYNFEVVLNDPALLNAVSKEYIQHNFYVTVWREEINQLPTIGLVGDELKYIHRIKYQCEYHSTGSAIDDLCEDLEDLEEIEA